MNLKALTEVLWSIEPSCFLALLPPAVRPDLLPGWNLTVSVEAGETKHNHIFSPAAFVTVIASTAQSIYEFRKSACSSEPQQMLAFMQVDSEPWASDEWKNRLLYQG